MSSNSQNVLIVAHEFYPLNTGGSHRPFRMAKYLKTNGFNPIVVTLKTPDEKACDASLQLELDLLDIRVTRVPIKSPDYYSRLSTGYYINVVDDHYRRWKKNLLKKINLIKNEFDFGSVIITAPPFSMTSLVSSLKKGHPDLKVILDMRDAWVNWNVTPYASKFHYLATLKKERKAFERADYILATSKVTMRDFQLDHPKINAKKFVYVPNSFDTYNSKFRSPGFSSMIKIGYVGSFYYEPFREFLLTANWHKKHPRHWLQYTPNKEKWLYRSPFFFFEIIQALIKNNPKYVEKIEVNFAGTKPDWFDEMVSDASLNKVVRHLGRLNKDEVKLFEESMNYLLITSSKREGKKDYSIAGKTYEYMSLQKPILAVLTDSAQKDILEPSGLSFILNPDNIKDSSEKFQALLDGKINISPNKKYCDQYISSNVLAVLKDLLI